MRVTLFVICVFALTTSRTLGAGTSRSTSEALNAVRSGDAAGLARLLDEGLNINSREKPSGQTLLMAASLAGQAEIVDVLLSRGANATIGEQMGYTPPHGAGFQGRATVVPVLFRHGLDLNDMHKDGYTGYHRALWGSEKRHTDTVAAFLDAGVDVNQRTRDGRHPLDLTKNAASRALLLSRGAKSDVGGKPGVSTPPSDEL